MNPQCRFKIDTTDQCNKPARNELKFCHQHRRYEKIGRPITSPATIMRRALLNSETRQEARRLLDEGFNPYDLTETTTMLHIVLERLITDTTPENLQLFFQASENIRKAAESVERIRASKAFTDAEYQATINLVVNIIELLPDDQQFNALEMLAATKASELKNVTPKPIERT